MIMPMRANGAPMRANGAVRQFCLVVGDGQVSAGNTVMKAGARKVRTLAGGKVITGFAGATADAFALLERLEGKLEQYPKIGAQINIYANSKL